MTRPKTTVRCAVLGTLALFLVSLAGIPGGPFAAASSAGASGDQPGSAQKGAASMEDSSRADPPDRLLRAQLLPPPDRQGGRRFADLLQRRRSVRSFAPDSLTMREIGQLLWAAGGTTARDERFMHRTTPSAGALYPLEFYLLDARGIARYDAQAHALEWVHAGDRRAELAQAALGQAWVREAPVVVVIAAEPERTKVKYGERGDRYVLMEVGLAAQNLLLQAVALDLAGVPVGAFDDRAADRALALPGNRSALLIIPLGRPR